jgi:hypothetical protein
VHARHVRAQPAGGLRRGHGPDADDQLHRLVEAFRAHAAHRALQPLEIEAVLRLDELGPGGDLAPQAADLDVERGRRRVGGGAGTGAAPESCARQELARIAHLPGRGEA